MASSLMSLKWNNHQPNFISNFADLYHHNCFVDVSLVADAQSIQAHRIILSACSPYFKTIFSDNPCTHPVVILKDVCFEDLRAIVEFMYHGEVSVSQERLHSVLKTAELLQIKGLSEAPDGTPPSSRICSLTSIGSSSSTESISLPPKRRKFMQFAQQAEEAESAAAPVKQDPEVVTPDIPEVRHNDHPQNKMCRWDSDPPPTLYRNEDEFATGVKMEDSQPIRRACSHESDPLPSYNDKDKDSTMPSSPLKPKRHRALQRQTRIRRETDQGMPEDIGSDSELSQHAIPAPKPPYSHRSSSPESPRLHSLLTSQSGDSKPFSNPTIIVTPEASEDRPISPVPALPDGRALFAAVKHAQGSGNIGLQRSSSSPQEGSSSGATNSHCPVQRDGPALGCYYCWNTSDSHGRSLRRKTKYQCLECQVNLCIVPCFQEFHEKGPVTSFPTSLPNTPDDGSKKRYLSVPKQLMKTSSI